MHLVKIGKDAVPTFLYAPAALYVFMMPLKSIYGPACLQVPANKSSILRVTWETLTLMESQDNSIQQGLRLRGFWVKKDIMYGEIMLHHVNKVQVKSV